MIHKMFVEPPKSAFLDTEGRVVNLPDGLPHQYMPQAYKDVSGDSRKGLSSFFAYGKRSAERGAYQQAHMTPSGVPGVVNLAVVDGEGKAIPFAPFNWNGRQMLTDNKGMIKYVEKDYFQTSISLENERVKYITQMISLVAGQPSENVIALFGWEFYEALFAVNAEKATRLYSSYLNTSGLSESIRNAKITLFQKFADAECAPEVMCNFGDNDPEWSKSFNKLSMLVEFHPTAILFDAGSLNPLESSGVVHGDGGHNNAGPPDLPASAAMGNAMIHQYQNFPDAHRRKAKSVRAEQATAALAAVAAKGNDEVKAALGKVAAELATE